MQNLVTVPGTVCLLVVALAIATGPTDAAAVPSVSLQTAEGSRAADMRGAAQEATTVYLLELDRRRNFEMDALEQLGLTLPERRQEYDVRRSRAWAFAQRERPQLIRTLDELGEQAPEDDWIVGHRVGFRVLHEEYRNALEVARSCRASRAWCSRLTGMMHQILGEVGAADSAFAVALEELPAEEECELRDISALLDRESARRYASMDCVERQALEKRFWWLAKPLHHRPVNDRRTEHLSRATAIQVHSQHLPLLNSVHTGRHHDLVLKRGWPDTWWGRVDPYLLSRYGTGQAFTPHAEALAGALADPLRVSAEDWEFDPESPRASGEQYDHPDGPVHAIDHQAGFFRRGDSVVVVGAVDLQRTPLALGGMLDAWLVLSRDPHDPGIQLRERGSESHFRFWTTAPAERYMVSFEVMAEHGGFGRARFGDGLPEPGPDGLALSSLLLLEAAVEEENLAAAYPVALGTTRLPEGEGVGLYWEVYGLEADEGLEVALRVYRNDGDRGFFRRLAETLRLVDSWQPVTLRWEETSGTDDVFGRVLDLDISRLEPGRYVIELEANGDMSGTAAARRQFEVVPTGS